MKKPSGRGRDVVAWLLTLLILTAILGALGWVLLISLVVVLAVR